jgi:hypothetical protein
MFLPKVMCQQLAALALSARCFIIVIFFPWAAKKTWEQLVFSFISSCFIAELQWPCFHHYLLFGPDCRTSHGIYMSIHLISITFLLGYSRYPYISNFCL